MTNFQLFHSNVLLGGQMKYDIVVQNGATGLEVSGFHITPISKISPYVRYADDPLMNYSHLENIQEFYKKTSGTFYNDLADTKLTGLWPIVVPDDNMKIDTHDSDFEMGCKRISYGLYRKQFAFFCPLWLEKVDNDIIFEFNIVLPSTGTVLGTKRLSLKSNKFASEYHNKFAGYLKNYLKETGISKGNDNIISVNLEQHRAQIEGINMISGKMDVKELINLTTNLTSHERPIMEFDNMIISNFKNNAMISSQLFNFNICFNYDDIFSSPIMDEIIGEKVNIQMKVFVDGIELEQRDFFTNYEYIPRRKCGVLDMTDLFMDEKVEDKPNVLNYLHDDKYVEYTVKNKVSQNICHWSLCDNNDYIFNMYEGFHGYSVADDGRIMYHPHLYMDAPNIQDKIYSPVLNNTNWCTSISLPAGSKAVYDINITTLFYDMSSDFSKHWVNNIRYNSIYNGLRVISICTPDYKIYGGINITGKLSICRDRKYIILMSDNPDNLTFGSVLQALSEYDRSTDRVIDGLYNVMNSADESNKPPRLNISYPLIVTYADSPSYDTTECMYYKEDTVQPNYMFRYSGKIKPTFIAADNKEWYNYTYYKKVLSDDRSNGMSDFQKSPFSKYSNTGFDAKYPSIGFYPYEKAICEYDKIPENKNIISGYEWHWYNNGKHMMLYPELHTTTVSKIGIDEYISIKDITKEYLKTVYSTVSDNEIEYIYNLYDIDCDIQYQSETDIRNYNYDLKLILK